MVCALSGLHLENDANSIIEFSNKHKIATVLMEYWIQVQGPTNPLDGLALNPSEIAQILCQGSNVSTLMKKIDDFNDTKQTIVEPINSKAMAFQRQIFQRQAMSSFLDEIIRKELSFADVELKLRVIFSAQIREFPTQFLNDLVQMYKTIVDIENNPNETKIDLYEQMIVRSHCRTVLHYFLTKSKKDLLELFYEPLHVLNSDLQELVHSTFSQTQFQNIETTLRDLQNVFDISEINPGSWVIQMPANS